jgi:hypothetical protein
MRSKFFVINGVPAMQGMPVKICKSLKAKDTAQSFLHTLEVGKFCLGLSITANPCVCNASATHLLRNNIAL